MKISDSNNSNNISKDITLQQEIKAKIAVLDSLYKDWIKLKLATAYKQQSAYLDKIHVENFSLQVVTEMAAAYRSQVVIEKFSYIDIMDFHALDASKHLKNTIDSIKTSLVQCDWHLQDMNPLVPLVSQWEMLEQASWLPILELIQSRYEKHFLSLATAATNRVY